MIFEFDDKTGAIVFQHIGSYTAERSMSAEALIESQLGSELTYYGDCIAISCIAFLQSL